MGPGEQISLDVTPVAEAVERAEMAVRLGVNPGVHVMGDNPGDALIEVDLIRASPGMPDSVEGARLREAAAVGIR